MRAPCLPGVAQLANRLLLAVRDEDRVVAEATGATRRVGDAPVDDTRAPELLAVGRERDELGHIARASVLDALELAEQLGDRGRSFRRIARRLDAGPAAERGDLEPGILA